MARPLSRRAHLSQAFLDKNRDALGADLVNCLKASTH